METPVVRIARLVLLGAIAAPVQGQSRELTTDEQVAHVLSRLTFGARPGDAADVKQMGVDKWIARQLRPRSISDGVALAALSANPSWTRPLDSLVQPSFVSLPGSMLRRGEAIDTTGQVRLATMMREVRLVSVGMAGPALQFGAGKVVLAETSERQLYEVMADFWENHFTVYSAKVSSREALIAHHRDAVRPHALGRFRDLLGAVAHSPAMLFYLDNHLSTVHGLNENYARELLELHTLGVDGGYTQDDVVSAARILTGWGIDQGRPGPALAARTSFMFRSELHDEGEKILLGYRFAAGHGIDEGEAMLDILARHPSTANHIARKLARRLVSDDPPASLVSRAAETFLRTDGDIAAVVETIVTSDEFFSRAAFRAKVKTPFEFVVSARRAFSIDHDQSIATAQLFSRIGQPMYGRAEPDGWPDVGAAWMNAGAVQNRVLLAADFAEAKPPFADVTHWRGWARYESRDASAQADGVIETFLGGIASDATRAALVSAPGEGRERLATMVAIALGSPEFQRR